MKNNNRIGRINDEIHRELSNLVRSGLKDPRIGPMTSVLRVDTTPDLKYCKVYVSVLGGDEEKQNVMKGLKNAGGYLRHRLAEGVNLRNTPELIFKLDDSVEYSLKINKLINEISKPKADDNAGDKL